MATVRRLLADSPLIRCNPGAIAAMEASMSPRIFSAGAKLVAQQREINEVGVICEGEASLVVNDRHQNEYVSGILRPGDFYGVILIFTREVPMMEIVADEPLQVQRMSREAFDRLTAVHADLRDYFYRTALERLADAYQVLAYDIVPPRRTGAATVNLPPTLRRSVQYIDDHYMDQLTLQDVAREGGMSKFHFCRTFKAKTNCSFKEYLNRKRIGAAKHLMREKRMNVSDACFSVGFNNLSYFSKVFRNLEGMTPSQFMRER